MCEKTKRLSEYWQLNKAIDKKLREYERLRAVCEKSTASLSGMPRGSGTREDTYIKLAEQSREIDSMIDKLCEYRRVIARNIPLMQTPTQKSILIERYINFRSWRDISIKTGLSENYLRHGLNRVVKKNIQYIV